MWKRNRRCIRCKLRRSDHRYREPGPQIHLARHGLGDWIIVGESLPLPAGQVTMASGRVKMRCPAYLDPGPTWLRALIRVVGRG